MASPSQTFDKFQSSLESYIKPREQVNYIRRILALHLGSCSHDGPIKQPLSLTDRHDDITLSPELKGIQREYIEAVRANVEAQRNYTEASQPELPQPSSSEDSILNGAVLLEERIVLLKLQNKKKRLAIFQGYLDDLMQKPAAAPEFLDVEDMFHEASVLPQVPQEVLNGLVAKQSAAKPDLQGQVAQLEKTILRAKLVLRREEQLLRETRTAAQNISDVISNGTKLGALNATRNELIDWIETELGNASGGDEGDEGGDRGSKGHERFATDQAKTNGQLMDIKNKYAKYLEARRSLLSAAVERIEASHEHILSPPEPGSEVSEKDTPPTSHLLTPYIEALLSLSKSQKAMITQKAHTNAILSKGIRDACQSIGHLSEESQLIPSHPASGHARRRSALGEVLASAERTGFTGKVQPWVLAADTAKITTLENVAEQVERGQVALETSMQALQEVDQLLGRNKAEEVEIGDDSTGQDFWLDSGPKSARKHTGTRKDGESKATDAWSGLHGSLGLIGQEDAA